MRKLIGMILVIVLFSATSAEGSVCAAEQTEGSVDVVEQITFDALAEGVVLCNDASARCVYLMEELLDSREIELSIDLLKFVDLIAGSDTFMLIVKSELHRCEVVVTGNRGCKTASVIVDGIKAEGVAVLGSDSFSIRIEESAIFAAGHQWDLSLDGEDGITLAFVLDRYRYDQNSDIMNVEVALTAGKRCGSGEASDSGAEKEESSEFGNESNPIESDPEPGNQTDSELGDESNRIPGTDGIGTDQAPGASMSQVTPTASVDIVGKPVRESDLKKAVPWLCAATVVMLLIVGVIVVRLETAAHIRATRGDFEEEVKH